jgi:hypothetical protein
MEFNCRVHILCDLILVLVFWLRAIPIIVSLFLLADLAVPYTLMEVLYMKNTAAHANGSIMCIVLVFVLNLLFWLLDNSNNGK